MRSAMTAVSVDLAYRKYSDIGIAVLRESSTGIDVSFPDLNLRGDPCTLHLAEFLVSLCRECGSTTLLIDGPQAWKDPKNGLEHSRVCERTLNTPAKTGLPGIVKPTNYTPFVSFSIELFDRLGSQGWQRFSGIEESGVPVVAESFPLSAWKSLGLTALPAKKKCKKETLEQQTAVLSHYASLNMSRLPSHDELQAAVAGLAGIPLAKRNIASLRLSGCAPFSDADGVFREGFIVNPLKEQIDGVA